MIAQRPPGAAPAGSGRLAADLASGAWDERNGHLRELEELDVGLRLIVSDSNPRWNP